MLSIGVFEKAQTVFKKFSKIIAPDEGTKKKIIFILDLFFRQVYNNGKAIVFVVRGGYCMEEKIYTQIAELVDKADKVDYTIQLPETEYDVMCAIWEGPCPLTTAWLMQNLGNARNWKAPTLISFLGRLEERGFVGSVKKGRERYYFSLADREIYTQCVTKRFMARYHKDSFVSFLNAMYPEKKLPDAEIDSFINWLHSGE